MAENKNTNGNNKKVYVISAEHSHNVIRNKVNNDNTKSFWAKLFAKFKKKPINESSKTTKAPQKPGIIIVKKQKSNAENTAKHFNEDFYLNHSIVLKSEIDGTSLSQARIDNQSDILRLEKLFIRGELKFEDFKRHPMSKNPNPISLYEVVYKMRIAIKNFPRSSISQSMNNIFSGKVNPADKKNLYTLFAHIDDNGHIADSTGRIISSSPQKNIPNNIPPKKQIREI